ncbi:helix-turn-helix transcriptional regulator [Yinghuangia seranimata]|uniref:helix-turn-helix domain-containing protein n=1 Tax=Yinghuangia seranimata TaxID=408067 RepID=UPI0031BBBADC
MAIRQGGGSSVSGNVRLKALRHARGWVSQQQLADAFEKKALECGLRLAVSVRQVRRWESADPPWPTPDYQKVLQELFGRPLAELGFTPPWQAELEATGDVVEDGGLGPPGGSGVGGLGGNGLGPGGNGFGPAGGGLSGTGNGLGGTGNGLSGTANGAGPGLPGPRGYPPPPHQAGGSPLGGAADTPRFRPGERFSRAGRASAGMGEGPEGPYRVVPRSMGPPGPGGGGSPGRGAGGRPGGDSPMALAAGLMPEPAHTVEPRFENGGHPNRAAESGLIVPGRGNPGPPGGLGVERLRTGTPALIRAVERVERMTPADPVVNVPGPGRTGRLGSPIADQYARLTASYRQMYWVAPAPVAYAPVVSHVHMGMQLLDAPGPGRPRRVLAASLSETAMLAGRIAFFDMGRADRASSYYQLADHAAHEAEEPLLRIAVFAHQALMPAFARRQGEARALIARANNPTALANANAPALMRSWLFAVNAEIESLVGDKDLALHYIDRAEDLLCHPDDNEVPIWLDFFDSSRLWGFRGGAELAAKRYDAARDALTDALGDLPVTSAKQQAITCADLARVAAASGDVDEASGMLSRALEALTRQWYSLAMDRIREVRGELEPFKHVKCIRRLDEELLSWEPIEGTGVDTGDERRGLT